jgi:hypothetical protein
MTCTGWKACATKEISQAIFLMMVGRAHPTRLTTVPPIAQKL